MKKQNLKIRKSLLIFIPFILLFVVTSCIDVAVGVSVKEMGQEGLLEPVEEADVCIVVKGAGDSGAMDVCDEELYPGREQKVTDALGKVNFTLISSTNYWLTVKKDGYEIETSGFAAGVGMSIEEILEKMNCVDNDEDGYFAISEDCLSGDDCDDANPNINPGADEICNDGIDDNCDGEDEECCENGDQDLDEECGEPGFEECVEGEMCHRCKCFSDTCIDEDQDEYFFMAEDCPGGIDCDDSNPLVYPGAPEILDGLDNNCDSITDDTDGDGIMDDGDGSGIVGDAFCTEERTTSCDDNCPLEHNPDQIDVDMDGKGIACDDAIEFSPEVSQPIQDLIAEAVTKCPQECTIKLIKDPDTGADTFNITDSIVIEDIEDKTITLTSEEGVTILNTREGTDYYSMIEVDTCCVDGATVNLIGLKIDGNKDEHQNSRGINVYGYNDEDIFIDNNEIINNHLIDDYWGGAGIYASSNNSNIYILNNKINGNVSTTGGGALSFYAYYGGENLVSNNTFSENSASRGGGVYIENRRAHLSIENNTVLNNFSSSGGGIYVEGITHSKTDIINNDINANESENVGGGIYAKSRSEEDILILNNRIHDNNSINGGAINAYQYAYQPESEEGSIFILSNKIYNNSADDEGGGIRIMASTDYIVGSFFIANNIIHENSALNGGGVYERSGFSEIINNTINNNVAVNSGGGIYLMEDNTAIINNLITNSTNNGIRLHESCTGEGLTIYNNGFKNNTGSWPQFEDADFTYGASCYSAAQMVDQLLGLEIDNNLSCEPYYENPADVDSLHISEGANDCINKGYTDLWDEPTDAFYLPDEIERVDIEGETRVIYDRVDLGAYEFEYSK